MPILNLQKLNNLFKNVLIILLITSCSFRNDSLKRFFSDPSFEKAFSSKNLEEVFILSSNGFQGQLELSQEVMEGLPSIKVGGSDVITSYVDITREKYPNLLFLDSGNIFDLKSKNFSKTLALYDSLNIDGVALTDTDLSLLFDSKEDIKVPLINSNLIDMKLGKNVTIKSLSGSKVLEKGKVKIAVFSVLEPKSSSNIVKGIYIKDPIFSLLKEKEPIGKEEVHLNILMATIKSGCVSDSPMDKKPFKDHSSFQLKCPENDQLFKFISRLPPNFIDLIILNNNLFADGFIGELPIIQNPGRGKFFSRIKITYDLTRKKIVREKSEILPPLKTCHHFFASTEDCHLGPGNLSLREQKRIDWILESGNEIAPAIYLGEKLQNWSDSITN